MYKYNVEKIENDINIQLHNELAKDESVENLTDYNVDVMDMGGDNLYSIRLNLVWTTMSIVRNNTRDIYNVTRMLMEQINNSKRGWSE